jgi:hypothetical protein
VRNLGSDLGALTGGSLFVGVEALTSLPHITAAGLGTGTVLSRAVTTAYKDSAARRDAARRHEFFYLLQLQERL